MPSTASLVLIQVTPAQPQGSVPGSVQPGSKINRRTKVCRSAHCLVTACRQLARVGRGVTLGAHKSCNTSDNHSVFDAIIIAVIMMLCSFLVVQCYSTVRVIIIRRVPLLCGGASHQNLDNPAAGSQPSHQHCEEESTSFDIIRPLVVLDYLITHHHQ